MSSSSSVVGADDVDSPRDEGRVSVFDPGLEGAVVAESSKSTESKSSRVIGAEEASTISSGVVIGDEAGLSSFAASSTTVASKSTASSSSSVVGAGDAVDGKEASSNLAGERDNTLPIFGCGISVLDSDVFVGRRDLKASGLVGGVADLEETLSDFARAT